MPSPYRPLTVVNHQSNSTLSLPVGGNSVIHAALSLERPAPRSLLPAPCE